MRTAAPACGHGWASKLLLQGHSQSHCNEDTHRHELSTWGTAAGMAAAGPEAGGQPSSSCVPAATWQLVHTKACGRPSAQGPPPPPPSSWPGSHGSQAAAPSGSTPRRPGCPAPWPSLHVLRASAAGHAGMHMPATRGMSSAGVLAQCSGSLQSYPAAILAAAATDAGWPCLLADMHSGDPGTVPERLCVCS